MTIRAGGRSRGSRDSGSKMPWLRRAVRRERLSVRWPPRKAPMALPIEKLVWVSGKGNGRIRTGVKEVETH